MSHPDPLHDRENEYPFDEYSSGPSAKKGESAVDKLKRLIGESKEIRHGNLFGKKKNMAHKMSNDERLKKHNEFVKKHPNKHSPYVKYEKFDKEDYF